VNTAWQIQSPRTQADFDALYDLRWRLLRAPWRQPRGSERDAQDASAIHALARHEQGELLGIARLHRLDAHCGQIRYMAVRPEWQGRGIGTALLAWLEDRARQEGLAEVLLNARESSVGFYRRRGYAEAGEGPVLFGTLHHRRMRKALMAS